MGEPFPVDNEGHRPPDPGPVEGRIGATHHQVIDIQVAAFDDPETAYESRPRPDYAPRFSDYDHLARVREWSALGDEA